MKLRRVNVVQLLHEAVRKWQADNCIRLGASLSYYTIFSLFPLILVALLVVRLLFVNSEGARELILTALSSVTGGFREDFDTALKAASETRRASGIIGTALLLLGSTWVFGELVSAFNIIWGLEAPSRGGPLQLLRTTFSSFALVLAGIFLLLVSMIISALLAALGPLVSTLPGGELLWRIIHTLITFCTLTLVFAMLLRYLPQTYVAWGDVWLGAILTALVWSLLQLAIAEYIALSSYKDYGPVGAILALVAWVYLSSQVLFFGGEFTAVYARRYGSRAAPQPITTPQPAPLGFVTPSGPPPASAPAHIVDRAAGFTLGVIGTLGVALLALLVGVGRAVRRVVR